MSPASPSLRVALAGYGYAGRTFHAPLITATEGLELVCVVSASSDKVRRDLPGMAVVATPDDVFGRTDVDLVVLAGPNDTHAPLARAALDAGKHVVVEKPFTLSLEEARAVAAQAAERRRVLAVFHNRRWDSDFLAARAFVSSGALGEISQFESHFDRYRPHVRDRWRERAGAGSGLWFDLGPHLVDQALQLFGPPDTVQASFAHQRPGAETDDWAHVILGYGSRRAILQASMLVAGRFRRMVLHGAAGTWVKHGFDVQESQLVAGQRPGTVDWGQDRDRAIWYDGASGERSELEVPAGDYLQFYRRLKEAILRGGPNPVPPAEAVAVMAVVEAAQQAAVGGCVVAPALTEEERRALAVHRSAFGPSRSGETSGSSGTR